MKGLLIGAAGFLALGSWSAIAAANTLTSLESHELPNKQIQVILHFSSKPQKPLGFSIENPATIALDFTNTELALRKRIYHPNSGTLRSIAAAQAHNRTRLVFNLLNLLPYKTRVQGDDVIVTLGSGNNAPMLASTQQQSLHFGSKDGGQSSGLSQITGITFHRGKDGGGLLTLKLTNPNQSINVTRQAGNVVVDAHNASIPPALQRRMVVTDFGTPVDHIDALQDGKNVKLVISANGNYQQLAYQADNKFTVDIKPVKASTQNVASNNGQPVYKGKRISLDFQNIPVRSVLQLLADFTGLNIVVSDAVSGNVTLRLRNVPWDQALAIILQAKGLAERRNGNVIVIAPANVLDQQEQEQLRSQKAQQELAPLHTEIFQIRYAKVDSIAALLKSIRSTANQSGSQSNNSQSGHGVTGLTSRGSVVADKRTNALIVRDTDQGLASVAKLIKRLDVPVKQVLIGARLVDATKGFSRDLGVTFGSTAQPRTATSGGGSVTIGSQPYGLGGYPNGQLFNVNLPAAGATTNFGITLAKLDQTFNLNLELSAAEDENKIREISNPRVITANDQEAEIQQGTEIPYQQASSSGATNVSFKTAALKLDVTPHITPNNHVLMLLDVTNDTVGGVFGGVPSINTQEVKTQVMVKNGQTVVLGGIYTHKTDDSTNKVPFLGDLPVLGALFREHSHSNDKTELLIFITPKIINNNLSLSQ